MFLTNNSPESLCFTKFRQNNLYLPSLPRISANSNKNYRRCNCQAIPEISRKFPEILNLRKFYNPSYRIYGTLWSTLPCLCGDCSVGQPYQRGLALRGPVHEKAHPVVSNPC